MNNVKRLVREKLRGKLIAFGRVTMPNMCTLPSPRFHSELALYSLDYNIKLLNIIAPRHHAKAQSLNSSVLTPYGWTIVGELKVGDEIIGGDGLPTKVTHLHPVSKMKLYRMKTRDGRSVLCNKEHMWKVTCPSNTGNRLLTKSLGDIMKNYGSVRNHNTLTDPREQSIEYRYFIDTVKPIEFSEKKLEIDPYTLGAWLGDGTSSGNGFTSADSEILSYFPYKITKHKIKYGYGILKLTAKLRRLNILNNKHIPERYLVASVIQRTELLQGLVDTDGTVSTDGKQIAFCNKNEKIIDGIIALIRSLGGTVHKGEQLTRFDKYSEYKHSYRITARFPKEIVPVRLKRKLDKWKGSIQTKAAIVDISYETTDLGRCITVDAKDGLYITDDYLVTHNSSVLAAMLPLYHLVYDEGPKVVVLSSKTLGHAIQLLQTVKDVLEYSIPFRQLYGYWGQHSAKVWTKDLIQLKNGDVFVAKGTGQQIHGMKFGNQRPTLFILDDPEDENNTKTAEAMEFNLRWLLQAVVPALDQKKGRCVVVGTPEHQRCIVETLKDSRDWKTLHYSALIPLSDMESSVPEVERYRALWSELMNVPELLAKRDALEDIGRVAIFYRQYMCQVIGEANQLFGAEGIQYYDGSFTPTGDRAGYMTITSINNELLSKPEKYPAFTFTGVDPASSTLASRDYSAVATMAKIPDGRMFILPYFRARVKPLTLADEILRRDDTYTPRRTYIERTGYQEMLRDYVREQRYIPGLEIDNKDTKPRMQKSARLEAMQPDFFQKKFFLLRNMSDLENELLMYPFGAHDDLLDGMYYAWKASYTPHAGMVISTEDKHVVRKIYYDGMIL